MNKTIVVAIDPVKQRQFAVDVVRTLREQGFTALWAGGCVRDRLLGDTPKDYDVATNATPAEVREAFGKRRTLEVGAAFGVIVVLGPRDAGQIDVATFRQDATYSDGRRPDSVAFSSPELDAQRRDFTINGLFFDPLADEVIDYVGGQADLAQGVIRAIGDPRQRLAEDKLRMMRAVRFAARFGFGIEPLTLAAIEEMSPQVTIVSAERIALEMRAMLTHSSRGTAVDLLHRVGLLRAILPEAAALADSPDRDDPHCKWQRTLQMLARLRQPNFPVALAALLYSADTPGVIDVVTRRWKLSNHERTSAAWLSAQLPAMSELPELPWHRQQPLLVHPQIEELLSLYEAWAGARDGDLQPLVHARQKLALPAEELNPPLLLTGDNLLAHGVRRGPVYARLLQQVRDAQLEGQIRTRQEALQLVDQLLRGFCES